eukprot:tig00000139_g8308.t1
MAGYVTCGTPGWQPLSDDMGGAFCCPPGATSVGIVGGNPVCSGPAGVAEAQPALINGAPSSTGTSSSTAPVPDGAQAYTQYWQLDGGVQAYSADGFDAAADADALVDAPEADAADVDGGAAWAEDGAGDHLLASDLPLAAPEHLL